MAVVETAEAPYSMRLPRGTFAEIVKAAREKYGLTQEQLAELVRVHAREVQRWEAGKHTPDSHSRAYLCRCFGWRADALMRVCLADRRRQSCANR